uniref:Uncharacterized protein n=1 Tax=Xenopus tropicalis TaxID=8364 RepID=A0A1B8Y7W1_XENTR
MCLVPFEKILSHTTLQTYCSIEALHFLTDSPHFPGAASICYVIQAHRCCRLTNVGAPNGRAARCVCMCSRVLHIMCTRPANGAMHIMSTRPTSDTMLIMLRPRRVYMPLKARNNRIACSLSAITVYTRV